MQKLLLILITLFFYASVFAQENPESSQPTPENNAAKKYKKRVLETIEVDFLTSYYSQDGDNAAVTGGIGTEDLQDATGTIVIAIPLNDDDVLVIDAGVSAYTSASSSNINPFDGPKEGDPFVASSGESEADVWSTINLGYSHSSDDRNTIWSLRGSFSSEYDYRSVGLSGSVTKMFNEKNTELSLSANVFFDRWSLLSPAELGGGLDDEEDEGDDEHFNINNYTITGNMNYNPTKYTPLTNRNRNSYAAGIGFSQILTPNMQGSLAADVIYQSGQLSTPFQRVYFADVEDSFIEKFHLADDIERLPDTRLKLAFGGRLHYYINEFLTVRTFYRYYFDDWGVNSHTASVELPIKIMQGQFTLYPSYRFYNQLAADYFKPYNEHLSTDEFYTSDYDLSNYNAHQYGLGIGYNHAITKLKRSSQKKSPLHLKSIDLKSYFYDRNTTFSSYIITAGVKFTF